ncbi:hypothetical protein FRB99_007619 [Tulasnella sp. 403]|nr:hypothetical protein FRB99_007619 [Tulasnella sp. 403]
MSIAPSNITVHYLNDSRAQRIIWLLEELEVPYEVKRYERLPSLLAPPELARIHPLGRAPVITDGDIVLAESGAIVEYIINKYGKGKAQPPSAGWLDNLYYTHYAEGTLMPFLSWKLILTMTGSRVPFFIRPVAKKITGGLVRTFIDPQLQANLSMIDMQLKKHPGGWLAGGEEPTSADYMLHFPLEAMETHMKDIPQSMKDYVQHIHERPAYQRALERGGDYAYARK